MKFHLAVFFALMVGCGPRGASRVVEAVPQKIVCMSSSHVAFLCELGLEDKIVYYRGNSENIDYEAIAAAGADLVLLSGLEDERLERLGVRTFAVGEWKETTPLKRSAWIVKIADVCGVPEKGEARYKEIEKAYNEQIGRTREVAAVGVRKKVMLNAPYRDVWFVPGEDNFMVRLIEDAGGEVALTGEGSKSSPVDIESAWRAMRRADLWLNTNDYTSVAALLADNPRMADTPPVLNGQVFNNNARQTPDGGSDFWESGVVRPDLVLGDLIAILHGAGETDGRDTLYYYRRLR